MSEVPAIALTAHVNADARIRAFQAGFDAYVAKPVDRDELLPIVARLAQSTGRGAARLKARRLIAARRDRSAPAAAQLAAGGPGVEPVPVRVEQGGLEEIPAPGVAFRPELLDPASGVH